ncbi:hypothetical protein BJV82DRAFT_713927 [Fennellomyces sp. T-0311]|nr:hypothetical protein BJV82DRAFT_713927 [Fennellomyces sp. T-0311]
MPVHLVFFIHGMGQQYEEYGNITHHVATIQKNTQDFLDSLYPDDAVEIKFIPIEWHSVVHALVDAKMEQATMDNVPKVRLATNQWLMDCLYYFSKPYGQCIIDTICRQCNEAYRDYGSPDNVHMIGFSLGGIAAYDILAMQSNVSVQQNDPYACSAPDVCVPKLDFSVQHLFTCGSPIAAALIFRGLDYQHYRPSSGTRVHNVFHPYDPLGYRLEPMTSPDFLNVPPVRLSRAPPRRRLLPRIPDLGIKTFITQYYALMISSEDEWVMECNQAQEEFCTQHPRVDYMLNETVIDMYASEWIIALKSHFRYWANRPEILRFTLLKV